jgi:hypothetical protein
MKSTFLFQFSTEAAEQKASEGDQSDLHVDRSRLHFRRSQFAKVNYNIKQI